MAFQILEIDLSHQSIVPKEVLSCLDDAADEGRILHDNLRHPPAEIPLIDLPEEVPIRDKHFPDGLAAEMLLLAAEDDPLPFTVDTDAVEMEEIHRNPFPVPLDGALGKETVLLLIPGSDTAAPVFDFPDARE